MGISGLILAVLTIGLGPVVQGVNLDGKGGGEDPIFVSPAGSRVVRRIPERCGDRPAPGDFTGDGAVDIAVYRPTNGLWAVRQLSRIYWGRYGDLAVPADFSGDGTAEVAVYRPSAGFWAIRGVTRAYWGRAGDVPVPGDFNGDGAAEIAVYRPSAGFWAIRGVTRAYWGRLGDIPVPGDFRGDGTAEIAVYRPSAGFWAVRGVSRVYWGRSGDIPVPGDYTAESRRRSAIFRPGNGCWAIRGVSRIYFGARNDQAVPRDYNGDGTDQAAIYRPGEGFWAIRGLTRCYFGIPVTPTPSATVTPSVTPPPSATPTPSVTPRPSAPPAPSVAPQPSITPSSGPIDLAKVRWLDQDISGWPETANLQARPDGSLMRLNYDQADVWPPGTYEADGEPIVGNAWVFVKWTDGRWYAATWEWLRPGQTAKNISAVSGSHIRYSPLNGWEPSSGKTYGFMVSTQARLGHSSPIDERSNVSMVVWP